MEPRIFEAGPLITYCLVTGRRLFTGTEFSPTAVLWRSSPTMLRSLSSVDGASILTLIEDDVAETTVNKVCHHVDLLCGSEASTAGAPS